MGKLVRYGFPLMMIGFLGSVFETQDRLFITHFLGFKSLGFYSIALMTLNTLNGIPNSIGIVTLSHFQEKYGATQDRGVLHQYVKKADMGYGILMAFLIGGCWFLVPWLVRLMLPEFVNGIGPLKFVLLGAYFTALSQAYSQLVYVIRKHYILLILLFLVCIVGAGANLLALRAGLGVQGVAAAMAFSAFIYFTLLFFYASSQIEAFSEAFKRYAGVVGLFAAVTALLIAIDHFVVFGLPLIEPWVKAAVFMLCMSPFLFRLSQDLGLAWPIRAKA